MASHRVFRERRGPLVRNRERRVGPQGAGFLLSEDGVLLTQWWWAWEFLPPSLLKSPQEPGPPTLSTLCAVFHFLRNTPSLASLTL